jgi:alpha-methylacyl-CoA racemase
VGPLEGFKIIEIAGIGPGQYCGMLLADMGAEVLRIERPAGGGIGFDIPEQFNLMNRGRSTLTVDLKSQRGAELVLRLCEKADAFFEGFRPGVMERLGLGPDTCMARNPRLVYGRMTGWGQDGPLADRAGHDANFVALSGVMNLIGEKDSGPLYPPMLAGDLAGGGAYLAMGLLAALLEVSRSGKGQVIDAAIIDGALSMLTPFHGFMAAGLWREKGQNMLDGDAPFVSAYLTADKRHIFVSPLEPKFFRNMLELMGIDDLDSARQYDPDYWPVIRRRLETVFRTRSRDDWADILEGADTCCTPVLDPGETAGHAHIQARELMVDVDGISQPAPAPRFSRTKSVVRHGPGGSKPARDVLIDWGLEPGDLED